MQIEDLNDKELARINEVGNALSIDAIKDFQIFLIKVNGMQNWCEEYMQFKKSIELKELQGYQDKDEETYYLKMYIYWRTFLEAEDGARLFMYTWYNGKEYPFSEGGLFLSRLKEDIINALPPINNDIGRPASSIQFKTIDENKLLEQIRKIIKTKKPNAKGTDTGSMHKALFDLGELEISCPETFHKWLTQNISEHDWGSKPKTTPSNPMNDTYIPNYKKMFKSLQGTKK